LDSGMMMGRSTLDAICLTIWSENAADCVEVPISMVGSEFATTSARGDAGARNAATRSSVIRPSRSSA